MCCITLTAKAGGGGGSQVQVVIPSLSTYLPHALVADWLCLGRENLLPIALFSFSYRPCRSDGSLESSQALSSVSSSSTTTYAYTGKMSQAGPPQSPLYKLLLISRSYEADNVTGL